MISIGVALKIPFFDYRQVYGRHANAVCKALLATVRSGRYILQSELRDFEEALASYCGARYAIGVANATDGLEMIAGAVGLKSGDEVLMPSHTFVASVSAIKQAAAKPVFVEIGSDHQMDPDDIEHRISERTRAIMPTQLNGRAADMQRLVAIANRHGLMLLEDSAQGLGARFRGRMAGTFGVAGVYSFYPAKLLGALGDGGVIVTDDESMAREFRQVRDHGRDAQTGEVVRWGRNTRLDNIQAAVLLAKLTTLDDEIHVRRKLAQRYHDNLQHLKQLILPPPPDDDPHPIHFDVYQNYEIRARDRDALRTYLSKQGVGTILQWGGKGVHQYPALKLDASLPRTEAMLKHALLLPMNPSLTTDEVDYICEQIESFYAKG